MRVRQQIGDVLIRMGYAKRREVEAALQRVEDGTYGIDEHTGEPINPARLEAIPTARTNV